MRNRVVILLFLASAVRCLAGDLITSLDAAWNRHDYPACRKFIQTALHGDPSNLTARVAMAAYHGWVEFDLAAATNSMPREVLDPQSEASKVATDVVDIWRVALSVPMAKAPTEQQMEVVRRELWPTNYPEHELLLLLQQQKNKIGTNTASHGTALPRRP